MKDHERLERDESEDDMLVDDGVEERDEEEYLQDDGKEEAEAEVIIAVALVHVLSQFQIFLNLYSGYYREARQRLGLARLGGF